MPTISNKRINNTILLVFGIPIYLNNRDIAIVVRIIIKAAMYFILNVLHYSSILISCNIPAFEARIILASLYLPK